MNRRFVFRRTFIIWIFFGLVCFYFASDVFIHLGLFQKPEHWVQACYMAVSLFCFAGAGFVSSSVMRPRQKSPTHWETLWSYYALFSIVIGATMIFMAFEVNQFDGPTIEMAIASLTMAFQIAALIVWLGFHEDNQAQEAITEGATNV